MSISAGKTLITLYHIWTGSVITSFQFYYNLWNVVISGNRHRASMLFRSKIRGLSSLTRWTSSLILFKCMNASAGFLVHLSWINFGVVPPQKRTQGRCRGGEVELLAWRLLQRSSDGGAWACRWQCGRGGSGASRGRRPTEQRRHPFKGVKRERWFVEGHVGIMQCNYELNFINTFGLKLTKF